MLNKKVSKILLGISVGVCGISFCGNFKKDEIVQASLISTITNNSSESDFVDAIKSSNEIVIEGNVTLTKNVIEEINVKVRNSQLKLVIMDESTLKINDTSIEDDMNSIIIDGNNRLNIERVSNKKGALIDISFSTPGNLTIKNTIFNNNGEDEVTIKDGSSVDSLGNTKLSLISNKIIGGTFLDENLKLTSSLNLNEFQGRVKIYSGEEELNLNIYNDEIMGTSLKVGGKVTEGLGQSAEIILYNEDGNINESINIKQPQILLDGSISEVQISSLKPGTTYFSQIVLKLDSNGNYISTDLIMFKTKASVNVSKITGTTAELSIIGTDNNNMSIEVLHEGNIVKTVRTTGDEIVKIEGLLPESKYTLRLKDDLGEIILLDNKSFKTDILKLNVENMGISTTNSITLSGKISEYSTEGIYKFMLTDEEGNVVEKLVNPDSNGLISNELITGLNIGTVYEVKLICLTENDIIESIPVKARTEVGVDLTRLGATSVEFTTNSYNDEAIKIEVLDKNLNVVAEEVVTGDKAVKVTGLLPNTNYTFRVLKGDGTSFLNETPFLTNSMSVNILEPKDITQTSLILSGNVSEYSKNSNGKFIIRDENGIEVKTVEGVISTNGVIKDTLVDGLEPGKVYFVQLSINTGGIISLSESKQIRTSVDAVPTPTSTTVEFNVNSYSDKLLSLEILDSYGNKLPTPKVVNINGDNNIKINGLLPNTMYKFVIKDENREILKTSVDSFKTEKLKITPINLNKSTQTSISLSGNVSEYFDADKVEFIINDSNGVVVSKVVSIMNSDGSINSVDINGLNSGESYFVEIFIEIDGKIIEGDIIEVKTLSDLSVENIGSTSAEFKVNGHEGEIINIEVLDKHGKSFDLPKKIKILGDSTAIVSGLNENTQYKFIMKNQNEEVIEIGEFETKAFKNNENEIKIVNLDIENSNVKENEVIINITDNLKEVFSNISEFKTNFLGLEFIIKGNELIIKNLNSDTTYEGVELYYKDKNGIQNVFKLDTFKTNEDIITIEEFVLDVYNSAFGRQAEDEGFIHWSNKLREGEVSFQEFVLNLLNEGEFIENHITAEEKIEGIYRVILNREVSESDKVIWIDKYSQKIKEGYSESEGIQLIANEIVIKDEFKNRIQKIEK